MGENSTVYIVVTGDETDDQGILDVFYSREAAETYIIEKAFQFYSHCVIVERKVQR